MGHATQQSKDSWAIALDYVQGRKRAEESLGFLDACGRELAETLDCSASLPRVAAMCVPFLGDWCQISSEDPKVRAVHRSVHTTPEEAARFEGILPRGETACRASARAHDAGPGSVILLPISAREVLLGTFALARTAERGSVDQATLAVARELCRRLAAALEIARLHLELGHGRPARPARKASG